MIRSVIMVRLRPGVTDEQVTTFLDALAAVPYPGRRSFSAGRDLGLVPDTMDIVTVSDFDDADGYRGWVADPRHKAVAGDLLHPIAEQIVRAQFEL
jgi:hypothetical protein